MIVNLQYPPLKAFKLVVAKLKTFPLKTIDFMITFLPILWVLSDPCRRRFIGTTDHAVVNATFTFLTSTYFNSARPRCEYSPYHPLVASGPLLLEDIEPLFART